MRALAGSLALLSLAACGSPPPGPSIDAGVLDGWTIAPPADPQVSWVDDGAPTLAPPAAPAWTCPSGWRSVTTDGITACEPWPESGAPSCDATSMAIPGGACATVGSACAADGWPTGLPASGVRHVRAGASGGDGSRAAPFGTIAQALTGITAGTTIALATGEHVAAVALPAGVALVGACASGTTLRAPDANEDTGVVDVTGAGAAVRDLTITGPRPGVTVLGASRSVTLERVIVRGVVRDGVLVVGTGTVTASDVLVRDVASRPSLGRGGRAFDVQEGGQVTVERLEVRQVHNAGVVAWDPGTLLVVRDAWIHDVLGDETGGALGYGVDAEPGGAIQIERVVVEDVRANGLVAQGAMASIVARDVVVRDVAANVDGTIGGGAACAEGANLVIQRASFDRVVQHGISARDPGTTVMAEDVMVRDVAPRTSDGTHGSGIEVDVSGTLEVTRAVVARAHGSGLFAGRGATLRADDVAVDGTLANGIDGLAPAVQVLGATLEIERGRISRSIGVGVVATDDGTNRHTTSLSDVLVDGVGPVIIDTYEFGTGIFAELGTLTLVRVVVRDTLNGIAVRDGDYSFTDVAMLDFQPVTTQAGGGFFLGPAARVTAERIVVTSAYGWGGFVFGEANESTFRDLVVRDVQIHPEIRTSFAFAVATQARLTLERAYFETAGAEAITAFDRAFLLGTDIRVVQSGSGEPDPMIAPSAIALGASHAELERVDIEAPRGVGLRIEAGAGGPSTFRDLVIRNVAERPCGSGCPAGSGGHAFTATRAASVVLDRFELRGAAVCGMQILAPDVTATRGRIASSAIGVNVQVDDFDPARLAGVELTGNEVDLDARVLPLPGTSPAPEPPPVPAPMDPTGG